MNDKIIDKIKKLLALATSDNEHEASRAAEQAHRLLLKHNLTEQSVRDRPPLEYGRLGVDRRIFARTEDKFVDTILQEHFFVRVITSRHLRPDDGGGSSRSAWYERDVILIGTKSNVEVAAYIRHFLIGKFRDLWLSYKRENDARPRDQQPYYLGLMQGLGKKLLDQRHRVEAEMSLVLVKDPALDELVKDIESGRSSKVRGEQEVILHGLEDGKKIEIQRGLEEKSTVSGKFLSQSIASK
jgi:hypothetical protein